MINYEIKKFVIRILIAALITAIVAWLIFNYFIPELYLPVLPWMLIFFTTMTIVSHGVQLKLARSDMNKFARGSMIFTMIRLLVYSFFAIIYLAINKENAVVFIICLVVLYLIFTILETIHLTRILKK